MGVQAANVRVIEAKASVGTDEGGRYRIVVPASFRGQSVPVSIRAIGFKGQSRNVRLDRDTVTLTFEGTTACAIVPLVASHPTV